MEKLEQFVINNTICIVLNKLKVEFAQVEDSANTCTTYLVYSENNVLFLYSQNVTINKSVTKEGIEKGYIDTPMKYIPKEYIEEKRNENGSIIEVISYNCIIPEMDARIQLLNSKDNIDNYTIVCRDGTTINTPIIIDKTDSEYGYFAYDFGQGVDIYECQFIDNIWKEII